MSYEYQPPKIDIQDFKAFIEACNKENHKRNNDTLKNGWTPIYVEKDIETFVSWYEKDIFI